MARGPDAIVVTSERAPQDLVLEAARRGVHVLCNRWPPPWPMPSHGRGLPVGVVLATAFPVHFSPAVEALRTVADGTLGEVIG